jgi:hypothetical protein
MITTVRTPLLLSGLLLTVAADVGAQLQTTVSRAVSLQWPSKEDRDYSIWQSTDMTHWHLTATGVPGNGGNTSWFLPATKPGASFFRIEELPGPVTNRLIGLTNLYLESATPIISGLNLRLANIRMSSTEATPEDSVDATLSFDRASQSFKIVSKIINTNLRVFHHPYFAKDVAATVSMTGPNGEVYQMSTAYSIVSTGQVFSLDLRAGHVISFLFQQQSDDYEYRLMRPDGGVVSSTLGARNTGLISQEFAILQNGIHRLRILPLNQPSVTLTLSLLNANRRALRTVVTGDYIHDTFATSLRDYAKYKIHLNAGDLLSLPKPGDTNIRMTLVNAQSAQVAEFTGLPLLYRADSGGDYYLFVFNAKGWGQSYAGTVTITSSGHSLKGASPLETSPAPSFPCPGSPSPAGGQ